MSTPILTNEGILCVPDARIFAPFCRDAAVEQLANVGGMLLHRFLGTGPLRHAPFYALVDTANAAILHTAVQTVLAAGALTVIHLDAAHPLTPDLSEGSLLVVEAALRADGTRLSATPGMVRKLLNRLGNHRLTGQPVELAEQPGAGASASNALTCTLLAAAQARQRPAGALLVATTSPATFQWARLYPLFAEILGRAAHYR